MERERERERLETLWKRIIAKIEIYDPVNVRTMNGELSQTGNCAIRKIKLNILIGGKA